MRAHAAAAGVLVATMLLAARAAHAQVAIDPLEGSAPPPTNRGGWTFEVNAGLGYIHLARLDTSDNTNANQSALAPAAFSGDIGGFLTGDLAVTARLSTVILHLDDGDLGINAFFGPSAQIWLSDEVWLRGGVGLEVGATLQHGPGSVGGLGFDTGIGYVFQHDFNVELEVLPSFGGGTSLSATFLVGYQRL